ncbi:MAG: zinc-binding dehydrogenase [Candidatus Rokubacteria bacterium]|nr:zinc-binding dehydrogenase [Candidatus Rokubacteria bacterium]
MKAIVMRAFGPPKVLRLEEIATPVPGAGEVLIRVHAVSVNRTLDLAVRAGTYPARVALPHVLGVDPSGVIAAVGDGVTARKVGDRVATRQIVRPATTTSGPMLLGVHTWGGYAEYVKVPVDMTHAVPAGLDFVTATVVARHGPTALSMLRDAANLTRDEWVLVMGAAGGLGSAGIQVAKEFGAKVIAAAGADERVRAAVELGADAGVNYRAKDLTEEVRRITDGRGVDVVFENIADPALFPKAFATLARNGRLVTAGAHGGGTVPLDVQRLYLNGISVIGSVGRITADDLAHCLRAAAEGRHRVLLDRVMPLADAALAHRIVAERSGTGKVVLQP